MLASRLTRPAFAARYRALDLIEATAADLVDINNERRLTVEARQEMAAGLIERATTAVVEQLDLIDSRVAMAQRDTQTVLDRVQEVDEAALAVRAQILSPVLAAAATRPERLIEVYKARFDESVSRRLLAETAENVALILDDDKRRQFNAMWMHAQEATRHRLSAEEKEALQGVEDVAPFRTYASAVRSQALGMLKEIKSPNAMNVWRRRIEAVDGYEEQADYTTDRRRPWQEAAPQRPSGNTAVERAQAAAVAAVAARQS